MENTAIERLATDRILDNGVRLPMRTPFFLRWLGIKTISLTVRSPYEGTMQRVAGYYLSTGLVVDNIEDVSTEQALVLMAKHGEAINKAVAVAWLNGYWSGKCLTKPLAWYIRWHCKPEQICKIATMLLIYGGTSDFMNTTRSVRLIKTMSRVGQKATGS